MPYPGEHSCRIHSPDLYQKESFRRIKRGKYSMVIAKRPGKDTTEVQSFRYPISDWTEDAAKNHCKDQGGAFETASKEEKIAEISAEELLELAEQNPELADYQLGEKTLGVQIVEGEGKEVEEGDRARKFHTIMSDDGEVLLVLGEKGWKLGAG